MVKRNYDFAGWATVNDLKCTDGRTIRAGAFSHNDGKRVPLVWNHQHNDPSMVLGHADLFERPQGIWAEGYFNDTKRGRDSKKLVQHDDVISLSIWANQLRESPNRDVLHGDIKELSLVLAGANPGAFIDEVLAHGDVRDDEAIMFFIDDDHHITHGDDDNNYKEEDNADMLGERTVGDIYNEMTEEQQDAVAELVAMALDAQAEADGDDEEYDDDEEEYEDDEEDDSVQHNAFYNEDHEDNNVLSHADQQAILADAMNRGSLREAVKAAGLDSITMEHSGMDGDFLAHGLNQIDYLYPDVRNLTKEPQFIQRDQAWVSSVLGGVHHSGFSRIRSMFADITADEARAKGYVKGNIKLEEVFGFLKRTTSPTTVYKLQAMDRDDKLDITDFDVVSMLKSEMRMMLNEEIARAILIGDGRTALDQSKIKEDCIRPIWTDADLFTIKYEMTVPANATDAQKAKLFITSCVKSKLDYKGSGNTTLFCSESLLIEMMLLEDTQGYRLYRTEAELASALRCSKIVTVPVMNNPTRTVTKSGSSYTNTLWGLIVNMSDYNVGTDRGGEISLFDDFDIQYNKERYLIETRLSGALTKPYSAIAIETSVAA